MKWFLGIDPGLSGALAFYSPNHQRMAIYDMPVHEIKVNGTKKRRLDLTELARIIDALSIETVSAVIEEVNAMPKQGVSSSFNFGFNAGCAQMVVAANFIPYTLVRPATWKKALGVPADKDGARRFASRLLPGHSGLWPLVKHDGRAEAALLALWLSKQGE